MEVPFILGALASAASTAVRHRPELTLPDLPRMADFALPGEAAAPALGWEQGPFLQACSHSELRARYRRP